MYTIDIEDGLFYRGRREGWILKITFLFENSMGTDEWQRRRNCVNALIYVVLSRAEKHVPYGELVGTTECITS